MARQLQRRFGDGQKEQRKGPGNVMTAQAATPNQLGPASESPALVVLARGVVAAAAVSLLGVGMLLAARRLAGPISRPLPIVALMLVVLVLAAVVSGLRTVWWYLGVVPCRADRGALWWWLVCSLAVFLLAVAVSIAGTGPVGLGLLWGLLTLIEGAWWYVALALPGRWRRADGRAWQPDRLISDASNAIATGSSSLEASGHMVEQNATELEEESLLPADVTQQVTRSRPGDGADTVAGLLRGDFEPGERSRSLHVAFCPPMATCPTVDVVQMSGPDAQVKAAEAQPYGIRFDVRLSTAGRDRQSVLIHFEARATEG